MSLPITQHHYTPVVRRRRSGRTVLRCIPALALALALPFFAGAERDDGFAVNQVTRWADKQSLIAKFPPARCVVQSLSDGTREETCDLPATVIGDPLFAGTGAMLSFHMPEGRVEGATVLVDADAVRLVANRLADRYGEPRRIASPLADRERRKGYALLWDLGSTGVIVDLEKTELDLYFIAIAPKVRDFQAM